MNYYRHINISFFLFSTLYIIILFIINFTFSFVFLYRTYCSQANFFFEDIRYLYLNSFQDISFLLLNNVSLNSFSSGDNNFSSVYEYSLNASSLFLFFNWFSSDYFYDYLFLLSWGGTSSSFIKILFDLQVTGNSNNSVFFTPTQSYLLVSIGEPSLCFFELTNLSSDSVSGTCIFGCYPEFIYIFITKVQCFCFDEIRLKPHEKCILPLLFIIDPVFLLDIRSSMIQQIVFSYVFIVSL